LRKNIDKAIENIHLANEMIEKTSNEKTKKELSAKNERKSRRWTACGRKSRTRRIFQRRSE
jgi:small acid-soluble spore protein (thioredoxin-like protein)